MIRKFQHFAYFIDFATLAVILAGAALYSSSGSGDLVTFESPRSTVTLYRVALTSNSSGDSVVTVPLSGHLLNVAFDPQAASPSANYDVTLTDQGGTDILLGNGANLSATATSDALIESATYPQGYPVAGDLTLTGDNMGSAKVTWVYLWVSR